MNYRSSSQSLGSSSQGLGSQGLGSEPARFSTPKDIGVPSSSSLLQMNDDCLMPSYESKAVITRTAKKILQDLEKRLLFAPALELDAEISALSELQTSIQSQPELVQYGAKINQIKNQCQANRALLNRVTLAQMLAKVCTIMKSIPYDLNQRAFVTKTQVS